MIPACKFSLIPILWRSSLNLEVSKASTRYANFIFIHPICIVQNTHCINAWFFSLPHCRTNDADNSFWTGGKLKIGDQQAGHQIEQVSWIVWFLCWLAQDGGFHFSKEATALVHLITPLKPKQSQGEFSSSLASMHPGTLNLSNKGCCVSSFADG